MRPKAYVLMLARPEDKAGLSEAELREVRRLLGSQTCPLMAWKQGVAIGFIGTDRAQQTCDKIKAALGDQTRITVLELGPDQAQWGLPHHNQWIAQLHWLTQTETKESS